MKKCNKCLEQKTDFPIMRKRNGKVYTRNVCRECFNARMRETKHKYSKRDKHYSVYYLPEEHYVGMTIKLKDRIISHSGKGKITDGYEVLAQFESGIDAHLFETTLHQRGYHGWHYK